MFPTIFKTACFCFTFAVYFLYSTEVFNLALSSPVWFFRTMSTEALEALGPLIDFKSCLLISVVLRNSAAFCRVKSVSRRSLYCNPTSRILRHYHVLSFLLHLQIYKRLLKLSKLRCNCLLIDLLVAQLKKFISLKYYASSWHAAVFKLVHTSCIGIRFSCFEFKSI